jgi:hypothetical protein
MFRRVITIPLVSLTALLLVVGAPAGAVQATPPGTPVVVDLGQPCPFKILVEVTAKQFVRAVLPNGLMVITGPAFATVTKVGTDRSITYNISGPGTFDPATNRLSLEGQSMISNVIGTPFLITTSGKVSFIVNQPIDEPLRGHVSHDVCAELA